MIFEWLHRHKILNLIRAINDANNCLKNMPCTAYNSKFEDHLKAYRNSLMCDLRGKLAETYALYDEEDKGLGAIVDMDYIRQEYPDDFD